MNMQLREFMAAALKPEIYQRKGQRFANQLTLHRPKLMEALREAGLDPFHDDSKLWAAVEWVKQHWEDTDQ